MRRRQYIVSGVAVLYFAAVITIAFVPGSAINRAFWCWQVLAFVPVGTLLLLIMGRRRWWAAIAFGMLGAAWLEAAQSVWMPVGYADAFDVVWGSFGVTVGAMLAYLATAPRPTRKPESHAMVQRSRGREVPHDADGLSRTL